MKPKAELMRRLRKQRREKGLVELRTVLTPEQKKQVERFIQTLKHAEKKPFLLDDD